MFVAGLFMLLYGACALRPAARGVCSALWYLNGLLAFPLAALVVKMYSLKVSFLYVAILVVFGAASLSLPSLLRPPSSPGGEKDAQLTKCPRCKAEQEVDEETQFCDQCAAPLKHL